MQQVAWVDTGVNSIRGPKSLGFALAQPKLLARWTQSTVHPHHFAVWPDNEASVRLFPAVRTQWCSNHHGITGLNYVAVEVVIKRLRLRIGLEDFSGLQAMEDEVLEAYLSMKKK